MRQFQFRSISAISAIFHKRCKFSHILQNIFFSACSPNVKFYFRGTFSSEYQLRYQFHISGTAYSEPVLKGFILSGKNIKQCGFCRLYPLCLFSCFCQINFNLRNRIFPAFLYFPVHFLIPQQRSYTMRTHFTGFLEILAITGISGRDFIFPVHSDMCLIFPPVVSQNIRCQFVIPNSTTIKGHDVKITDSALFIKSFSFFVFILRNIIPKLRITHLFLPRMNLWTDSKMSTQIPVYLFDNQGYFTSKCSF